MEASISVGLFFITINFIIIVTAFPSKYVVLGIFAACLGMIVDISNVSGGNSSNGFLYPDSITYFHHLSKDSLDRYFNDPTLIFSVYGGFFHFLNVVISAVWGRPDVSVILMVHRFLFVVVLAWCIQTIPSRERLPLALLYLSPQMLHFTANFIKETDVMTLLLASYAAMRSRRWLIMAVALTLLTSARIYGFLAVFGLYDFSRCTSQGKDSLSLRAVALRQSIATAIFLGAYVIERQSTQGFSVSIVGAFRDVYLSMLGILLRPLPFSMINYSQFLVMKTLEIIAIAISTLYVFVELYNKAGVKQRLVRGGVAAIICMLPVMVLLTAEGQYVLFYYGLDSLVVGGDDIVRKKMMVLPLVYSLIYYAHLLAKEGSGPVSHTVSVKRPWGRARVGSEC